MVEEHQGSSTDLRHGERERLELVEGALASLAEGVLILDAEGCPVLVNPTGQRLALAQPDGQHAACTPQFVLRQPDGARFSLKAAPVMKALVGESVSDYRLTIDGAKGPIVHLSASARPLVKPDGGIAGAMIVLRDVTALVLAEEKAAQLATNFQDRSTALARANIDLQAEIAERQATEAQLKRSVEQLKRTTESTVRAMALAVEKRDPYTADHQRRVAELAGAIGHQMGLSSEQIGVIRLAGLIHDLGKISVPAEFLSKSGELSEIELSAIKTHATVGYHILETVQFPCPIAQIVHQHHERLDGSGYPLGVSHDEILLEARVLGVADVVEAMASHRPYRPALGVDTALEEISRRKGTLYDARAVDACIKVFVQEGFHWQ